MRSKAWSSSEQRNKMLERVREGRSREGAGRQQGETEGSSSDAGQWPGAAGPITAHNKRTKVRRSQSPCVATHRGAGFLPCSCRRPARPAQGQPAAPILPRFLGWAATAVNPSWKVLRILRERRSTASHWDPLLLGLPVSLLEPLKVPWFFLRFLFVNLWQDVD